MNRFVLLLLVLFFAFTSSSFASTITPAFGKFSSAGGSVDAGKQNINTMQVIGATFSKVGGKPTMFVGTYLDIRQFMDGVNGRPTLQTWQAAQSTTDLSSVLQAALNSIKLSGGGTLYFPNGLFGFATQTVLDNANDILITGAPGAILFKNSAWVISDGVPGDGVSTTTTNEYVMYFKHGTNIAVEGLRFIGATSATDPTLFGPSYYGDCGIAFMSVNGTRIENNTFTNFGDAVVTIKSYDVPTPPTSVDSFNSIVRGNKFINCQQTSTTKGGTENYLFDNNTFVGLKGSAKFASRSPGAGKLWITRNNINGTGSIGHGSSSQAGLEIVSYSNVFISENIIEDIATGYGITFYNNSNAVSDFSTQNITIIGNKIHRVNCGIRFSNDTLPGGTNFVMGNLEIKDNEIDTTYANVASIGYGLALPNGKFTNLKVEHNTFKNIGGYGFYSQILANSTDSHTENIWVTRNTFDTVAGPVVMFIKSSGSTRPLKNIHIEHNDFINVGPLSWTGTATLSDLYIKNNTGSFTGDMNLITAANHVELSGNYFVAGSNGWNVIGSNAQLLNNHFEAPGTYALRIDSTATGAKELNNQIVGIPLLLNTGTGGVLFADTDRTTTSDYGKFFWDNTNKRLSINDAGPQHTFQIKANAGENGIVVKSSTGTLVFAVDDTTSYLNKLYPMSGSIITIASNMKVNTNGHISVTSNTSPVLSSCGISPTIQANSSDYAGNFTIGSSGTGCVVSFVTALLHKPVCLVQAELRANLTSSVASTSAITIVGLPGNYSYTCTAINE